MKRCEALEKTFHQADAPSPLASPHIASLEQILETLENLITVHYSTSEATPETKVIKFDRVNKFRSFRSGGGEMLERAVLSVYARN